MSPYFGSILNIDRSKYNKISSTYMYVFVRALQNEQQQHRHKMIRNEWDFIDFSQHSSAHSTSWMNTGRIRDFLEFNGNQSIEIYLFVLVFVGMYVLCNVMPAPPLLDTNKTVCVTKNRQVYCYRWTIIELI